MKGSVLLSSTTTAVKELSSVYVIEEDQDLALANNKLILFPNELPPTTQSLGNSLLWHHLPSCDAGKPVLPGTTTLP